MDTAPDTLRKEIKRLREEISELESNFDAWNGANAAGGRILRSMAKRISLAAKRVEALVSENTYHKGGV